MIAAPLFAEPRGRSWYITDSNSATVVGVAFLSKKIEYAAIRALTEPQARAAEL